MDNNKQGQVKEFLIIFLATFVVMQLIQYFFAYRIEDKIQNISIATEREVLPPNIDTITHELGPYTVGFNTITGDLVTLKLHDFTVKADDDTPVETLFHRQHEQQIFQEEFLVFDHRKKVWNVLTMQEMSILPGSSKEQLQTKRVYPGFDVVDTYTMDKENPYAYTRESEMVQTLSQTQQIYHRMELINKNKALIAGTEQGARMFQGASFHTDKVKFKKLPFAQFSKSSISEISTQGWLSFSQRYFATALYIDKSGNEGKFYSNYSSENSTCIAGHISDKIVLSKESPTFNSQFKFYSGPENKQYLQNFAPAFEYVIDYGMLWFVSSAIMYLLTELNMFVQDWGLSIIAMTLALRGILQLFSFAQSRDSHKIQMIQQKQKELSERYGDDHEALNRALLQFYKEEKINPVVSLLKTILPLVFQIIMFLAFYSTLMEAVQLRQASFLYINDLSLRDPTYVMPILLVVLAYVQQFFSPPPEDTTFAIFMRFSPLMFGFIALSFPSGLVLYWMTSTLFALAQTIFTKTNKQYATA